MLITYTLGDRMVLLHHINFCYCKSIAFFSRVTGMAFPQRMSGGSPLPDSQPR